MTNTGAQHNTKTTTSDKSTTEAIATPLAIVGIGCLFPQSENKDTFWANIKGGVDSISDIPETHWRVADLYDPDPKTPDKTYGKRGGFLDPFEFNPMEFSIQPNIIEAIDTSQLLGLIAAREALKDAGYDPAGEFARERVSVLLGVTGALEMVIPLGARLGHPIWRKALQDAGVPEDVAQEVVERISDSYVPWQENSFPGLLGNVVAGRISKQFDLGGTNSVIDAACGSSLSALHMAAMELSCGRSDMVITGGIDTFNDIFMYTCFSKTPALSPSNLIRPFDSNSDGTLIGEGLGLVVIKRLDDAERDNDQIYAVIRGIGTASDGKKGAIYEPNANGQKRTLIDAYTQAAIDPKTITLVEAHGTGTKVGDATEISALRDVYGESNGTPWCALGSVKSQIGHAKASAGSAGLIKTALALHTKVLPPTINVAKPQEVITTGNSPFYVNTTTRPWLSNPDHPRRAAVSAFGFGGSNFHCVLEEYQNERSCCDWSGTPQIIALCATDKSALQQQLQQVPVKGTSAQLRRFAAQSRAKFDATAPQRLLFVIEEGQDLAAIVANAEKLLSSDKSLASTPNGIWYGNGTEKPGKMAVLFSGQGAQYPHMLRDLACHAPELLYTLNEADQTLNIEGGLSSLIYPHSLYNDADQATAMKNIQATQVAQPAIGTVSLGAWRYLHSFGLDPQAWGGHSYGELTALCAAGCYSSKDLYKLSQLRGELMAGDGSDKGTMLAVSASLDKIELLLNEEKLDLVLANRNTPSQGVLSGSRSEIERAAKLCKERGLRCVALDVAAAFHSKLVAAAQTPFLAALQQVDVTAPATPVYANKTAAPYPDDTVAIRTLLAEQLASPVEFVQQIEQMYADSISTFVEVGPGARLTGMVGKILKGKKVQALALDSSNGKRSGLNDLARCLIQLAAIGYPIQLQQWDGDYAKKQLALPEPKEPRMTVTLCGANYMKKKPVRPASQRKLVDANTLPSTPTLAPISDTAPLAPAVPQAIQSHVQLQTAQATSDSLRSLQENMTVLQRMQEDTAKLHNQFLEGQAAAVQTMRSLMDHQMGVTATIPSTMTAPVVTTPTTIPRESLVSAASPTVAVQPPQPAPQMVVTPSVAVAPASSGVDVSAALLEVVAEKTGYPQEMLELDMSLDADLGIDSIKRVEILSAIQEKLPELPALQPDQLGSLQTLRQIVEAMGSDAPATATPTPVSEVQTSPTNSDHSAVPLLQRQTIDVVPVEENRSELKLNNDAPIWVVDDCSPLSAAVVAQLKQRKFQAQLVSPSYNETPEQLTALVVIAPQIGTDSYFLSDAFLLIQRCGDALKRSATQGDSCLITVSRLDGQCGFNRQSPIVDPLSGGLAGITKTAHHEWPEINCKALDLGADLNDDEQADAIVNELLCAGAVEVGANRGGRVTLRLSQHNLPTDSPKLQLQPSDVVIISGGARGVTAEVAEALAKSGQPTLLLLGRSSQPETETDWLAAAKDEAAIKNALMIHAAQPLKPRELNEACQKVVNNRELLHNLHRLEQAGSRVIYRSVDIRDDQAVAAAINEVREFGTIRGVIHGAGVLADRKIEDKTAEQFALVYSTKIAGLQALLQATQDDPLKFIALFSSSTGRFGRTGQVDYAVANEVLNKTAQALARQRNDCRVVSLNWGPWDGGMVTPALKKIFAAEGIEVIDLQLGAQYLLQELACNDEQVELVILGGEGDNDELPPEPTNIKKTEDALDNSIPGDLLPNTLLSVTINSDEMPFLQDHVINGNAVVPMAMLVEWLAQGAMHNNPGLLFHGFDNLRIRKGVVLENNKSIEIELRCGALKNDGGLFVIPTQICNQSDGTIYTSADIVLIDSFPEQRPAIEPLVVDGGEVATQGEIYSSGQLFHGSRLQGLKQVVGNNNEGIIALSATAPIPARWMDKPLRSSWITDPQVIDSSFQMMILWCFAQKKLGSLPSFAGHYRQYCEQFPVGTTRIQCRVTKASNHSATANVDFIDEQSRQLLARIDGYECTMTEGLEQAFYNNKLHR